MRKKPSTKPKRTPSRQAKKPGKKSAPKIKVDPLKEYLATIQKDKIVEVMSLEDDDCLATVKLHISTQSLALDYLLNCLGIPTGRVTEIFGPPHVGKSTLLDHIFAEVQRMGGLAILADTEGARDVRYSRSIGVDPAKLVYLEFPTKTVKQKDGKVAIIEQLNLENVLQKLMESMEFWGQRYPDKPIVLGLDALGGTATRDEQAKKLEENAQVAGAAQVLRRACRQLPAKLGNTNIAFVIINHEYENIQTGGFAGKKRETYGGEAVRLMSSIRVKLFPAGEWVKRSDGLILGRVVGAKLIKNRLGNPWGEARIALLSGVGIDNVWSIFQKLKTAKLIVTSGSWSSLNLDGEIIKFQGWGGLSAKCQEDPTLFPRLVSVYKGLA